MNDSNQDMDAVGRLVQAAGPRSDPPPDVLDAMRRAGHAAWQEKVAERQTAHRRRRRRAFGLAAAAVVAVAAGFLLQRFQQALNLPAATVEVWPTADAFLPGAEITAGTDLKTAAGERAILRLTSGTSLRLDEATRVQVAAADAVELFEGTVYLDSDDGPGGVLVRTRFGDVRDVGTRFLVHLDDAELRVRVRDGQVAVQQPGPEGAFYNVTEERMLTVRADGSAVEDASENHGPAWDWLQDVPRPFVLEGATVAAYLRWLSDETGWRVLYEDGDLANEAEQTVVHGSLGDVRPEDTVDTVLSSAALTWRRDGGLLVVERP